MKKTIETAQDALIEGAEKLMYTAGSAEEFLLFLMDMIHDVHRVQPYEPTGDAHFGLKVVINEVVIPWFKGGRNVVNEVASGLEETYDFLGDNYPCFLRKVFDAWSLYCIEEGFPTQKGIDCDIPGLRALTELADCFEKYAERWHKENPPTVELEHA